MPAAPVVKSFFEGASTANTCTFVVHCPETKACAVIDSALIYDAPSCRTMTDAADKVIAYVKEEGLKCEYVLETHVHADHLTAAQHIKKEVGGKVGIGSRIVEVQKTFKSIFNSDDLKTDGSQFDVLFNDKDSFKLGNIDVTVYHTPGHTPACVTYHIGNAAFCGDTIFMPDQGTARCDFPGGSAQVLWDSVQRTLSLPPETRLFVGHDYAPGGRDFEWETTVEKELAENKHVKNGTTKDEFLQFRETRDGELKSPVLLLPSLQINMRAGHPPPPEANGQVYLKLPFNFLSK